MSRWANKDELTYMVHGLALDARSIVAPYYPLIVVVW